VGVVVTRVACLWWVRARKPRPKISPRPCSFRPSALCTRPSNCRVCCASSSINTTTIHPCRGHLQQHQSIRRAYATANDIASLDVAEDADVARTQQLSALQTPWLQLPTLICTSPRLRNHNVRHRDSVRNARASLEVLSADECHSDFGLNAFRSSSGDTPV
jgi:hypothetical protein